MYGTPAVETTDRTLLQNASALWAMEGGAVERRETTGASSGFVDAGITKNWFISPASFLRISWFTVLLQSAAQLLDR